VQITKFVAATALLLGGQSMVASVIKADFLESLDLPTADGANGPRIVGVTGVLLPSIGPQLTSANEISNPSFWANMLNVSFDSATNILSLTGDGDNIYQTITVTLSNLGFDGAEHVTGFHAISVGNAVVHHGPTAFSIQTSFSGNSVTVMYILSKAQVATSPLPTRARTSFNSPWVRTRPFQSQEPSGFFHSDCSR
jgi:hypothetical protein